MKKNHLRMLALAMAAMMSLTACGAVQHRSIRNCSGDNSRNMFELAQ